MTEAAATSEVIKSPALPVALAPGQSGALSVGTCSASDNQPPSESAADDVPPLSQIPTITDSPAYRIAWLQAQNALIDRDFQQIMAEMRQEQAPLFEGAGRDRHQIGWVDGFCREREAMFKQRNVALEGRRRWLLQMEQGLGIKKLSVQGTVDAVEVARYSRKWKLVHGHESAVA